MRRLLRELSERDILRDDIIENYTSESYIVKFSVSKKNIDMRLTRCLLIRESCWTIMELEHIMKANM